MRNSFLLVLLLVIAACTVPPARDDFNRSEASLPDDTIETIENASSNLVDDENVATGSSNSTNASLNIDGQSRNLIELYIAPQGEGFTKLLVWEGQAQQVNLSDKMVNVEAVIISNEGVILAIDGVMTKSLAERDSERVAGFDLYISHIYARSLRS